MKMRQAFISFKDACKLPFQPHRSRQHSQASGCKPRATAIYEVHSPASRHEVVYGIEIVTSGTKEPTPLKSLLILRFEVCCRLQQGRRIGPPISDEYSSIHTC